MSKHRKAQQRLFEKESMKRVGYLYEKITSIDNLILAVKNATKNKKHRRGVVKDAHDNPERFALRVKEKFDNGTLYFSKPYTKTRREHNKIRNIKVPRFYPDQIVHWALMQVIDPIINRGLYRYSCGSVKGRGTSGARKAIQRFIRKDPRIKYVYKADIHHFFESVDTDILKRKFRRVIKDIKVLLLIDAIIDIGGKGLPIGFYTSQGFSNFYLQTFDHTVKEKLLIRHYARYADDIVFLDRNKRKLHKAHAALCSVLKRGNLRVKDDWQIWRYGSRSIDFVGYRFYDGFTLLRKRIFYSLTHVVRKIKQFGLRLRQCLRFISYIARAKVINFKNYYLENIKPIVSKGRAQKIVSLHARTLAAAA